MTLLPVEKPPYRIPSMEEIRALTWNGFNIISTFAGCGGSSLGYRMAGFRVLLANEFTPEARESYAANKASYTQIDPRDIREVSGASILQKVGLGVGELDVLDGSPPCASFSMAGKRSAHWGKIKEYSGKKQRTDDLFYEFARLVGEIRPRVFVAENVSGLVKGVAKGYFKAILGELKGKGYRVRAKLLDAQWLGVPQARQRLIFIGVREDLGVEPVYPEPLPYRYSVRDSIPWVMKITGRTGPHFVRVESEVTHPMNTIMASDCSFEVECDISRYAIGDEWDKIKQGESSTRYFSLTKPDTEKPCPTITAAGGCASLAGVVHPTEKRKFTIAELKRLCSFPDDFVLKGSYQQQWERLGRAVPPVMMRSVAEVVRDRLLPQVKK